MDAEPLGQLLDHHPALVLLDQLRDLCHAEAALVLTRQSIADKLGKSDAAVRVMLTRSLKKLQDLLGDDAAPSQLV